MPLKKNMTLNDITDYLLNDLKVSVVDDILPCVNPNSNKGGYFGVPKLVMTYVDYLGALYHGYTAKRNKNKRRIFATGSHAKKFLKDVFGQTDPNYKKYGDLLWKIYRNGTIHLYEPLKLKNSTEEITWLAYKGSRTEMLPNPYNIQVRYLVPYNHGNHSWQQPISITCLYDDLLHAINIYSSMISTDHILETNFVQVADELQIPEKTKVKWW